jgi:glycosyltransferase involved in cell wall biosynthesis
MRVLLISHTCQSLTEGQPKARWIAQNRDIKLQVLMPDRWKHYGKWRKADPSREFGYSCAVERAVWPSLGPAQSYLHWYPGLAARLREFRPDIIDLWEEPWSLVSVQVCILRDRLLPQAKIVSETEQNIDKSLPFPFERFRSFTLRKSDFAVGRSSEAVCVIRSKGYKRAAEVVPNAVDVDLFRPMDSGACRSELGVQGFMVGYVGRLVEEKGLLDLLEAAALCPSPVNLLFVGSGPLLPMLQSRSRELGIEARTHFMPACPAAELPRIMNALDVLALPSRTTPRWKEQFGRVLIEAGACGIPVIGSDSGAIPDVVGSAGLIVPERNPAALAKAITSLHQCPERRRQMGEQGRHMAETRYSWRKVAEQMANIYRELAPE